MPFTTGDGNTYEVKLILRGGNIDPLTASYNYPGKVGSDNKRNSTASPIYDLFFYVTQDDVTDFIKSISSFDNPAKVVHPLYGDLEGEPTGISWDNSKTGDVPFTVQFKTNIKDALKVTRDFQGDTIKKSFAIQEQANAFLDAVEMVTEEINKISEFVDQLEELYENILNNEYINAFYDLKQTLNNVIFDGARVMSLFNEILNISSRLLPFDKSKSGSQTAENVDDSAVKASVSERLNLINQQAELILSFDETDAPDTQDGNTSTNLAIFKELLGAVNITAASNTVVTSSESVSDVSGFDITDEQDITEDSINEDLESGDTLAANIDSGNVIKDYKYKKNIDLTIQQINDLYNSYAENISDIDLIGENDTPYVPNQLISNNLKQNSLLSIEGIKESTDTAKEENKHIVESDTIPEYLAFKLYGEANDENISAIINDNDLFGLETLNNTWRNLVIKKNTEILYYA